MIIVESVLDQIPTLFIAKIEQSAVLTEESDTVVGFDLKRRPILKFAKLWISSTGTITAELWDSNRKIADYWWDGFLKLQRLRDDYTNSQTCFAQLRSFIKPLKDVAYRDYIDLMHILVSYLQTNTDKEADYNELVERLLTHPFHNTTLVTETWKQELHALPMKGDQKSQFDKTFMVKLGNLALDTKEEAVRVGVGVNLSFSFQNFSWQDQTLFEVSPDGKYVKIFSEELAKKLA